MKGKRVFGLVFVIVLILVLFTVGIVQAAGNNLTAVGASATINGAIFEVFNPDDPSGSGLFDSFVRISSNLTAISGYNTNYRPLQFQENNSPTFTKGKLLSEVPQFNVNGTTYREFQLDINQNTPIPSRYETLDDVELYESAFADLCGYPFDGSGGGHSGCTTNNTATLVYDMDAGENNFVLLDYTNNEGSGKRDLKLLVPNRNFNLNPQCNFAASGCTTFITLYSEFGADYDANSTDPLLQVAHGNNDGFEEWGVRVGEPTAITLRNLAGEGGEPSSVYVLGAFGLLVVSTGMFRVLRKRQSL